jgi:phosphoglycolate phosphatase
MEFIQIYEHQWPRCHLRAGAKDLLDAARAAGLSQAVLSAQQHDLLRDALAHHRILSDFDLVLGVDSFHARGKAAQGRVLMEQLRWKPAECLLVGDTLHDADVARELGVQALLLHGGNQSPPRLATAGLPVAASLDDVARHLGLEGWA